ncbi:putative disease resistance protein At3g14460 [Telopea speciosissima]|uniref:putative disease resistance protein At3g14460 n=1 Tax=Telopea speciosissima TaxID=54955 RepID=UPI001CC6FE5A|nr:putative disease resistance protein At3g14460 [Telopea speciosissima]
MAEDFIRDDGRKRKLEDIGSCYFDMLVAESFFLNPTEDFYQIDGDLHEFAESVSCGECLIINEGEAIADFLYRLTDSLRHFSLHCENYLPETANLLAGCKGLRTFLLHLRDKGRNPNVKIPDNKLTSFECLHVLDISCPSIIEVPASIGGLKHLRYLNLSKSRIEKLPKTICDLHSLHILMLHGCKNLKNLPCLGDLRSLKKLLLDKNHLLDSFPPGIGRLTMLETFSCPFVVGKEEGENIGVLKNLNNLRGSLCISNLENILNSEEAKEAALNNKQFLRQLKLKWREEPTGQCRFEHEQVLQALQPNNNLETLKILGYGGVSFPHEMAKDCFGKLKKVSLRNCKSCPYLPALWRLPMLETLCIRGMNQMVKLNNDSFLGSGSGNRLSSLEILKVEEMPYLKSCDLRPFPKLNQLTFKDCPMLEEIIELPMLMNCSLNIKDCPLLIGWMDQQQGWQKEVQDDGSLIYQKEEQEDEYLV